MSNYLIHGLSLNKFDESSETNAPDGLSKDEMEHYLKLSKTNPSKTESAKDNSQEKSNLKSEEIISELKEKLRKKEDKISSINKDREDLRKERDTNKARWERAREDLDNEQRKVSELKRDLKNANDEIDSLKKKVRRLESQNTDSEVHKVENNIQAVLEDVKLSLATQIDRNNELENQIEELLLEKERNEKAIARLNEAINGFDAERERFEDILSLKDNEIEDLKSRFELAPEQSQDTMAGMLTRVSPDTVSSELLNDGRYDFKLARNGMYALIVPNVEGAAVCREHRIVLPRLGQLMPFTDERSYPLSPVGNNILRVDFKRWAIIRYWCFLGLIVKVYSYTIHTFNRILQ